MGENNHMMGPSTVPLLRHQSWGDTRASGPTYHPEEVHVENWCFFIVEETLSPSVRNSCYKPMARVPLFLSMVFIKLTVKRVVVRNVLCSNEVYFHNE
jgi:hypothetical protein